jgi:hypothetical protein
LKGQKKKGGKLLVNFVKVAKIAISQVLNDLPFTTGVVLVGLCGLRLLRQADSTEILGQPGCIHGKPAISTHHDRPLNDILQFANIARASGCPLPGFLRM